MIFFLTIKTSSLLCISFSIIFPMFESRAIGVPVLHSIFYSTSVFRITLAILKTFGNITFKKDLSINSDNFSYIVPLTSLRILVGMPLRTEDLLTCSSSINLLIFFMLLVKRSNCQIWVL